MNRVERRVLGMVKRAWRSRGVAAVLALVALGAGPGVESVAAQDDVESAMAAAGTWVLGQLPAGETRLDPHRSGEGKDGARVDRVARALGAGLAPLNQVRECSDRLDPSTCTLSVARLISVGAPTIEGDTARVKVYAWYRSSSPREPVGQRSWEVRLRRSGQGWQVVSGG